MMHQQGIQEKPESVIIQTMLNKPAFPLTMAPAGKTLQIAGVDCGTGLKMKMADLGIVPGAELRLPANSVRGPVIVIVKGSRLALGRGIAQRIMVEERSKSEEA